MEWISVKKQLPPFEENVLMYWKGAHEDRFICGYLDSSTTTKAGTHLDWKYAYEGLDIEPSPTHWAKIEPPKFPKEG